MDFPSDKMVSYKSQRAAVVIFLWKMYERLMTSAADLSQQCSLTSAHLNTFEFTH